MGSAVDFSVKSSLEAFEVVVRHLLSQKQRATGLNGDCAYRGFDDMTEYPEDIELYGEMDIDIVEVPNGLLCAVGVLIRDEFYDPEIEGNDFHDDWVQKCVRDSHPDWEITDDDVAFLRFLQSVHDRHPVEDWASFLLYMITNYISVIDGDISWNFDGHYEMLLAEYKFEKDISVFPDVNDHDVFVAIDKLKGQVDV